MEAVKEPTFLNIQEVFAEMPAQPGAESNLYVFLHILSSIMLAIKHGDIYSAGWAKTITMPDGSLAFDEAEATKLEQLVQYALPAIEKMADIVPPPSQSGGAVDPNALANSILSLAAETVDPEDVSIDEAYYKLFGWMDKLDQQARSIARQIGPVAFTSELKIDPSLPNPLMAVGIPPPRFQIPARSVLPITNAVLELFRLIVTFSPFKSGLLRNLLTISIAFLDVFRGEWKYSLFTLLGLFGAKPLLFGVILKILRDAWMLIEPQLSKQLRLDIFKAGKSMFIGFWLWAFATFSPDFVRAPLEAGIGPFRALVDSINQRIEVFQEQANVAAGDLGLKVTFPTVPTEIIPSFADIQNLQTIVQQPEVFCSAEVIQLLEPIQRIPPLRFILELLNVPFVPELREAACRDVDPNNLSGDLAKRLQPQITILPGGKAEQMMLAVQGAAETVEGAVQNAQQAVQGAKEAVQTVTAAPAALAQKATEGIQQAMEAPVALAQQATKGAQEAVQTITEAPVALAQQATKGAQEAVKTVTGGPVTIVKKAAQAPAAMLRKTLKLRGGDTTSLRHGLRAASRRRHHHLPSNH